MPTMNFHVVIFVFLPIVFGVLCSGALAYEFSSVLEYFPQFVTMKATLSEQGKKLKQQQDEIVQLRKAKKASTGFVAFSTRIIEARYKSDGLRVMYKQVTVNRGDAFVIGLGFFRVRLSGIYQFSIEVSTLYGECAIFSLIIEGKEAGQLFAGNTDQFMTTGISRLVYLLESEKVWLTMRGYLCINAEVVMPVDIVGKFSGFYVGQF